MVMPLGGEESAPGAAEAAPAPEPARKGGVVTYTTNITDTGERQKMFGLTARHLKSTMSTEAGPGACTPANIKMDMDGWYADISGGLSCMLGGAAARAGGMRGGGCRDTIRMKRTGSGAMGYPLKQTITMDAGGHAFSTTTEVVELTTTPLEASLFEMPQGCRVVTSYQELMGAPAIGGTPGGPPEAPPAEMHAATPPPARATPPPSKSEPSATVAPKTAGVVRVGVVKLKDDSGVSLPTDNLRLNLMSEIGKRGLEAVPLDTAAPHNAVLSEAKEKDCDYLLYTVAQNVSEPGGSGVALPVVLKAVKLDPGKYQALLDVSLYKIGKPLPQLKNVAVAADADQFGVNAVMAGFETEAAKLADQVKKDAEARLAPAATPRKPAAKKPN